MPKANSAFNVYHLTLKFSCSANTLLGIYRRLAHVAWPKLKTHFPNLRLFSATLITNKAVSAANLKLIRQATIPGIDAGFFIVDGKQLPLELVNDAKMIVPNRFQTVCGIY
jgi:hypothetical protein